MNNELKKWLKQLEAELRFGWHYVYARGLGWKAPWRFCFHPLDGKAEGRLVSALRSRGLTVSVWRTTNGKGTR